MTRILKQLHGSVDLFVSAIIQQAQRRVESTKGRHENTVKELDDWIGSVVAAETASVGQKRKSMQMSIAAALETDGGAVPEGADQNLRADCWRSGRWYCWSLLWEYWIHRVPAKDGGKWTTTSKGQSVWLGRGR